MFRLILLEEIFDPGALGNGADSDSRIFNPLTIDRLRTFVLVPANSAG